MLAGETRSKIDAVVGATIGTIIAMNIMLGSGFLLFESANSYPPWQRALCWGFFIWCLLTELWFVLTTWGVIVKQEVPASVAVAMKQPSLPVFFRPLVSFWWLFQFLMGMVWGIGLSLFENNMPGWAWAVVAICISGFAYLTFGFLLLAITAFTKRHDVIERVWGWRGKWALAHGLIILATSVFIAPYANLE